MNDPKDPPYALGRPIPFIEKAIIVDLIRDESDPKRLAALANRVGRLANRRRRPPSGVAKLAKRAARGTLRRDNYFDAIRKNAKAARERIAP